MRLHPIAQIMADMPMSDVRRTLMYRPEFFGQPFSSCLQQVLRGPSDWTVGERELFASFTAKMNHCPF